MAERNAATRRQDATSKLVNPLKKCFVACHPGHQSILSGMFGCPRNGGASMHYGIDLYATKGTPCLAIGDGRVVKRREWDEKKHGEGFGNYLVYEVNDTGLWALYAHLSKFEKVPHGLVRANTPLGYTGVSGVPDVWQGRNYPHLHFEVWTTPNLETVRLGKFKYRKNPMDVLPFVSVAPILELMEDLQTRRSTA